MYFVRHAVVSSVFRFSIWNNIHYFECINFIAVDNQPKWSLNISEKISQIEVAFLESTLEDQIIQYLELIFFITWTQYFVRITPC